MATITPGDQLAQAFGHVALVFDEAEPVAYSYGGYVLPEIGSWFDVANWAGPWEAMAAATLESLLPVIEGTMRAGKVREKFATFGRHAGPFQKVLVDELRLTKDQLETLHRRIVDDFSRVEPGERTAGVYHYEHFESNCVTRLRDGIFGALGHDHVAALARKEEADESFGDVIEESLGEAIASNPAGVRLFPQDLAAGLGAFLPKVPLISRDPKEFLSALNLVLHRLSTTSVFSTAEGRVALAGALQVLNVEIPSKPRSFKQTVFTPRRLRETLANWVNTESGETVLKL